MWQNSKCDKILFMKSIFLTTIWWYVLRAGFYNLSIAELQICQTPQSSHWLENMEGSIFGWLFVRRRRRDAEILKVPPDLPVQLVN